MSISKGATSTEKNNKPLKRKTREEKKTMGGKERTRFVHPQNKNNKTKQKRNQKKSKAQPSLHIQNMEGGRGDKAKNNRHTPGPRSKVETSSRLKSLSRINSLWSKLFRPFHASLPILVPSLCLLPCCPVVCMVPFPPFPFELKCVPLLTQFNCSSVGIVGMRFFLFLG